MKEENIVASGRENPIGPQNSFLCSGDRKRSRRTLQQLAPRPYPTFSRACNLQHAAFVQRGTISPTTVKSRIALSYIAPPPKSAENDKSTRI